MSVARDRKSRWRRSRGRFSAAAARGGPVVLGPILFGSILLGPILLAGCLRGVGSEGGPETGGSPEGRIPTYRNLVLVLIDTLRADHLPSYGYHRDTAPHLARLAAEGVQLDGYASSSWTRPSVATLLTGHAPQRHQAISRADALSEEVPYLPLVLEAAGFRNLAVVGNVNVGRKWGFGRGFEDFRQLGLGRRKVDASRIHREALAAIDPLDAATDRFFLYLHYVDPHDPYEPPHAWGESEPPTAEDEAIQPRRLQRSGRTVDDELATRLRDLYDGEILDVDRAIEELLGVLDERGLLDETLVVVTSDHGEELGDRGGLLHGHTLFEELVRVPLILWAKSPRLPSSSHRPGAVSAARGEPGDRFFQVDLLATVLEALDLEPVVGEGSSRWSRLARGSRLDSEAGYFHLDLDGRGALAVRDGAHKLIHGPRLPHDRLYDLAADPGERDHATSGARIEELRGRLIAHHNGDRAPTGRRVESLDPETRRALEAMGYVDVADRDADLQSRVVPDHLHPTRGFR